MATGSDQLSRKELAELQGEILKLCRGSESFKKNFMLNGLKFGDHTKKLKKPIKFSSKELESLSSHYNNEYDWYDICREIVYDVDLISYFLYTGSESCNDYGDEDIFGLSVIYNFPNGGYLDEFIPNMLNPKYKWSKKHTIKDIPDMLYSIIHRDLFDSEENVELESFYLHIYGVNSDCVSLDIKTPYAVPYTRVFSKSLISTSQVSGNEKLHKHLRTVLERISDLGKPIKEVYFISNFWSNYIGNNFISRKNPDGEYTIVIF